MYYCRNVISRLSWGKKKKHLVKGQEELVESGGEEGVRRVSKQEVREGRVSGGIHG